MEGLGVDVFTYQPGPLDKVETQIAANSPLVKFLSKITSVKPAIAAQVALTELQTVGSGSGCGTNIKHEIAQSTVNALHFFPFFYRVAYNTFVFDRLKK
mmetsp:Transcript_6857/g.11072  ORF Transcript_6857/g.11072 Transcript_6857/m.11072 type:complete len:99 (-) Transcript_6857:4-300(-)